MAQRQINKGFVHFFKLCTGKTAMHKDHQTKLGPVISSVNR